jgi:hypothetical protein
MLRTIVYLSTTSSYSRHTRQLEKANLCGGEIKIGVVQCNTDSVQSAAAGFIPTIPSRNERIPAILYCGLGAPLKCRCEGAILRYPPEFNYLFLRVVARIVN